MNWQEAIGIVGGALGNIGIIPQVWRLFRLKSAYELSLLFISLWLLSLICWLTYGIVLGLLSLILWNSITLVLAALMMYAKLKWGMRPGLDPRRHTRS
jgi:MtN3 and saliva related transmembrane protein